MFPIGFYSHFNHIILPFKKHLCGARKKQKLISSPLTTSLHGKSLDTEFACFFMKFNT